MFFFRCGNDVRPWKERDRTDTRKIQRDARSYRKDYQRPSREGIPRPCREGVPDNRIRKRDRTKRSEVPDNRIRKRHRTDNRIRIRPNRPKSHSGKKQKAESDFGQGHVPIPCIFGLLDLNSLARLLTSEAEEAEFDS